MSAFNLKLPGRPGNRTKGQKPRGKKISNRNRPVGDIDIEVNRNIILTKYS